jgi:endonuclease YncB( thermonuclease family)
MDFQTPAAGRWRRPFVARIGAIICQTAAAWAASVIPKLLRRAQARRHEAGGRLMNTLKVVLCAGVILTIVGRSAPAAAETYKALVVKIVDGDTLDVFHDGRKERIRLKDIDCPELNQAYGRRARRFTGELAFNQLVTVTTYGKDTKRRTLAEIALPGGINLNQELVRVGYAWTIPESGNAVLARLENTARKWPRGLWLDPDPMSPWAWRKKHPPSRYAKFKRDRR